MNWIRELHGGQLVILGVVMGVIAAGFVVAGYQALDRLEEAQQELRRAEFELATEELFFRDPETRDTIDAEPRRWERRIQEAESSLARARAQVIPLFGAAVLVLIGYLAVAWVWFGGRGEGARRLRVHGPRG